MKLALYGFMGAGKSSLGSILAKRLGYSFIDLDKEIEKKTGMSIDEYFEKFGEINFRKQEHKILKEIISKDRENILLSLGGGTILQPSNRKILDLTEYKKIYLDTDLSILIKRLAKEKNTRPLIKDISADDFALFIEALWNSRKPIYEQAADIHVKIKDENMEQALEKLSLLLNFN